MTYWIFGIVLALNVLNNIVCYNKDTKANGLIWIGLVTAIVANTLWIWLAKNTSESVKLMFYAMTWDAITTAVSIGIPVLVFGARLPPLGWVGMGMAIVGLSVVRYTMA